MTDCFPKNMPLCRRSAAEQRTNKINSNIFMFHEYFHHWVQENVTPNAFLWNAFHCLLHRLFCLITLLLTKHRLLVWSNLNGFIFCTRFRPLFWTITKKPYEWIYDILYSNFQCILFLSVKLLTVNSKDQQWPYITFKFAREILVL